MRVIGGKLKRSVLKEVSSLKTRSTKDRVKESIFNIIMPYLYESTVLDLFAGSGALGIEALSREAKSCDFVEYSSEAYRVLSQNIIHLKLNNQAKLNKIGALSYLKNIDKSYDLIFLDPPYESGLLTQCLENIKDKEILSQDGIIVVLSGNKTLYDIPEAFNILKDKSIGITNVKILSWRESL